MLHVGTDEAGYGPLLGPLVIAAAVYETDAPRSSLRDPSVADSKVVYGRGGRDALARALGPYLGVTAPVRLSRLLEEISVRGDPRAGHPWYLDVEDAAFSGAPAPPGFRRLYVNPVCEREFNEGCRATGGKGLLLFRETMRLVRRALDAAPGTPAQVVCDKHGGRNRYAALLFEALEPSSIVAERESADLSSYRLVVGGRPVHVTFRPRAESADLPVALASMAAKYVRELFMDGLNGWFRARIADLRPTAGYYTDGLRFLEEVRPLLADLDVPLRDFVRER